MPCGAIATKQNNIIRILLRQLLEKKVHTHRVALWHDKKAAFACERFYCSIDIAVFPYMVTGNTWTYPSLAPAVFGLVNMSKACLILKHQSYVLLRVGFFQLLDRSINFFEDAISSSLAFLGCLLRGITLYYFLIKSFNQGRK